MSIRVTLNIEEETTERFEFNTAQVAKEVCEKVLETEGCPMDVQISLTLTTKEAIQSINRSFRGIDAPTDVLSFPNLSFESPSVWEIPVQERWDCMDPETEELLLGDIVINTEYVCTQAAEYGHSQKREYAFLIAHSMLHLCGYDHEDEEEAAVMFKKQEDVLQSLGISRESAS